MDPALADERHVAHDARGGEPGQVPHEVMLQPLRLGQREPPVLGERDHVAHVEVVRRDRGLVLQGEAQVEQLLNRVVDPAHQDTLVADRSDPGVQHRVGGAATAGVTDWALLTWVWIARVTPRARALVATRPTPSTTSAASQCCGRPISALVARRMSRMFSMSSSRSRKDSRFFHGMLATSPPETTTSRTTGFARR